MRIKSPDVDIRFLHSGLVSVLPNIEAIFRYHRGDPEYQLVITSGRDGLHIANSWHYKDRAIDLRIWGFSQTQLNAITADLITFLGQDYKVLFETTHIHIAYTGDYRYEG